MKSPAHDTPFSEPLPAQGTIESRCGQGRIVPRASLDADANKPACRIGRFRRGPMRAAQTASGPAEPPDGGPVSAEAGPSSRHVARSLYKHRHARASPAPRSRRTAGPGPRSPPTRSRRCAPEYRTNAVAAPSPGAMSPNRGVICRSSAGHAPVRASPGRTRAKTGSDRAYSVAVQPKSANIWINQLRRVPARCARKCCGRWSCSACRRLPPPMMRWVRPSRRFCRAVSWRSSAPRRQARPSRQAWICASMMR